MEMNEKEEVRKQKISKSLERSVSSTLLCLLLLLFSLSLFFVLLASPSKQSLEQDKSKLWGRQSVTFGLGYFFIGFSREHDYYL